MSESFIYWVIALKPTCQLNLLLPHSFISSFHTTTISSPTLATMFRLPSTKLTLCKIIVASAATCSATAAKGDSTAAS